MQNIDRIGPQIGVEFEAGPQCFSDGNGNIQCRRKLGVAGDILAQERLFEPGDPELFELATHPHRRREIPFLVGVDGDPGIIAQGLADLPDPLDVDPWILMADLHLDAHHPLGQVALEGRHHLGNAHIEPAAVGAVDRRTLPATAQKLVDRQAADLPLDIPQGQVDRRLRLGDQSVAAHRLQSPVELVPQPFVVEGVLVDQQRCKIVLQDAAGGRGAAQQAPGVPNPPRPVFGGDEDNRHVDVADRTALLAAGRPRLHRPRQRHPQQLGPDFGNPHDLFSPLKILLFSDRLGEPMFLFTPTPH